MPHYSSHKLNINKFSRNLQIKESIIILVTTSKIVAATNVT